MAINSAEKGAEVDNKIGRNMDHSEWSNYRLAVNEVKDFDVVVGQ